MNILQDNEILEHLKQAPIFFNFSIQDLARLLPSIQEQNYSIGEEIFSERAEANTLYLIIEGDVRITSNQCFVDTITEGFLGEEVAIAQPVYLHQATASKTTKLLSFDGTAITKLLTNYPNSKQDFSFSLLRLGIEDKEIIKPTQNNSKKLEKAEFKNFIGWLFSCLIPIAARHGEASRSRVVRD